MLVPVRVLCISLTAPAAPIAARPLTSGEVAVRSPMQGTLVSYQVKEGDEVLSGQPVCVLEAMKMQNTLNAPAAGQVKSLNAQIGKSVSKDAILLIIASA